MVLNMDDSQYKRGVQLKYIKVGILIIDKFHVEDYLVFWIIKGMLQDM